MFYALNSIFVSAVVVAIASSFDLSVQGRYLPIRNAPSGTVKVRKIRSDWLAKSVCPADLKILIEQMLSELPSYANRVIQRSLASSSNYLPTYIVLASSPNFELRSLDFDLPISADIRPVFFSTLGRQYRSGTIIEFEEYHWIFLAKTANGWQLVRMFSQYSTPTSIDPNFSQSKESNDTVVAETIRLWLRDCEARG